MPLVRCANNGLTCWIDSLGRVRRYYGQETGDVYGAGFISFEVPLGQAFGQTAYNNMGDVFGWTCFILFISVTAIRFMKRGLHTGREIG